MKRTEQKAFSITYSIKTTDELDAIKKKYTPQQTTEKLKELRFLDKKVELIPVLISIIVGIIGSKLIVLGSIGLIKEFFSAVPGAIILLSGLMIIAANPFFHTVIYNAVKKHYTAKILSLVEEIEENVI